MRVQGPALIDQANTTLFLSAAYDLACGRHGNFVGLRRGHAGALPESITELLR